MATLKECVIAKLEKISARQFWLVYALLLLTVLFTCARAEAALPQWFLQAPIYRLMTPELDEYHNGYRYFCWYDNGDKTRWAGIKLRADKMIEEVGSGLSEPWTSKDDPVCTGIPPLKLPYDSPCGKCHSDAP